MRVQRRHEIARFSKRTIDEVQAREDKLVALYVDGKLDDVTYQRQRALILSDKHAAMDRMSAASDDLDDKLPRHRRPHLPTRQAGENASESAHTR